jgi:hypothetical protein
MQPEHLLLAVVEEFEQATATKLSVFGVSKKRLEIALQRILGNGKQSTEPAASLVVSSVAPQTAAIVKSAVRKADRLGSTHLGCDHLLLALASHDETLAYQALQAAGVSYERLSAVMDSRQRAESRRRSHWHWRALSSVERSMRQAMKFPRRAYGVFVQRSLGHPGFVSNPYPHYRWLQEHDPVRKDPLAPAWVITRYDDVALLMRDPRFRKDPFAQERLPRAVREQLGLPMDSARSGIETISMLFLDPPQHTRVRAMFTRAFSPHVIESMRPRIEQITRDHLDRAAQRGEMDVIADLAYPLPIIVIAELLGFPPQDYQRIKRWSDDMAAALALTANADMQAKAGLARDELRDYFDQLVPKLKNPGSQNLLSALLATEHLPEALNREEIFSNAVLLLAAGHETTANLIGNGMLALLNHRDQLELLGKHPELIDSAVEEILRFDSPVQWTSRVSGEAIEIGGRTIEPGQIVLGGLGAANRDPRQFTEPDRLDLRRSPNRHIAFGQGPHFCLGATLAKMEASISILRLIERFPNIRLSDRKLPRIQGLTFRGVEHLPIILH